MMFYKLQRIFKIEPDWIYMSSVTNPLDQQRFDEFMSLLAILCKTYDECSNDIVALSISTAIRVLMHDTDKSTSLLSHLGKKGGKVISTNVREVGEPVHLGLVRRIHVGIHDGVGGDAKYWPLCDERYFPSPNEFVMLDQREWWEREIIFQSKDSCLTRKDLVLTMANKEGGAHFDDKIQKKYDDFRHSWSGGSSLVGIKSKIVRGYDNVPVRPAVRQIGYEVLRTFKS